MTSYHGGKQRIGKALAEVIVGEIGSFEIKGYCEPFCGMLGVYQNIPELLHDPNIEYKAGDMNESVVKMWKAAQTGWTPPTTYSEKQYNRLKVSKSTSAVKGFIGHQLSYGGIFFGGYAPLYGGSASSVKQSIKVKKIAEKLGHVVFTHGSYTQFSDLKGYVIYCDPPYVGTQCKYKGGRFNTEAFTEWCVMMAKDNIVFLSEYTSPDGNVSEVYSSKSKYIQLGKSEASGTEKLFMYH